MVVKNKIKRFLCLLLLYAKMDLAALFRDTKTALLCILTDLISNVASLSGIFMLAWRFEGVGGMSKYEVLFMLSYITLIIGVFVTFCAGYNVGYISRRIGRGQLEHMFLQPLSFKMQLMTEGFLPFTGSANLISGVILMIIALKNLEINITWLWISGLVLNILISIIIILSLSYLFASAAFYAPVAAEEISMYVIDFGFELGQYPLSGMPKYLQVPLLTILPAGLLGWLPSVILLGKSPKDLLFLMPVLAAALLFFTARILFKKGFKHYVKTGSNRYLPYGHRR